METLEKVKCFGGVQHVMQFASAACRCDMKAAVFTPPRALEDGRPRATLFFLSGLTSTEQNFITKSGFQRVAAELDMMVVAPDTSPRGPDVPGDPDGGWDFGHGAGFYLDATEEPWSTHYRMESHLRDELPERLAEFFPIDRARIGVTGFSMGGHGALTLHLKNPDLFRTCTAFAPIVAPASVPWGQKAFPRYLGADEKAWTMYDATRLISARGGTAADILIDQGTEDAFLDVQLKPDLFMAAAQDAGQRVKLRMQDGYNHSFYFVASFIEDHLRWHKERLEGDA